MQFWRLRGVAIADKTYPLERPLLKALGLPNPIAVGLVGLVVGGVVL